ncbi:3-isopropylmalate dehydratase large subunit [Bacillus salitolerans]|uniref:3-isopropylmalate dehydratase large subunit n=1 Tax=Bacillus salitolerans TaxID=1437434 RepID=A0ABW4LQD8_9BACI
MKPRTLVEKIWDQHIVYQEDNKPDLLYIDLHLIHEVTSPQAFEGLRLTDRKVRRPDLTFATVDHNVPTKNPFEIEDEIALNQLTTLERNCTEFGIHLANLSSDEQGIVHVIGPELGLTLPGKTIVCGDSHTSTHGAFGALAFGIGTSEVEHVLATQCLWQTRPKSLKVEITGTPLIGTTAKDIILGLIATYGVEFGTGYIIEFTGDTVLKMTMEERMTICNMAIEAGAKAGLIAPDEVTFSYIKGRKYAPKGKQYHQFVSEWKSLVSDEDATYDKVIYFDISQLEPQVTWGTNPSMGGSVNGVIPSPDEFQTEQERLALQKALDYMNLVPGTKIKEIKIDYVFIGSCTNSRIEDLREAASFIKGKKVANHVTALVVPGSKHVKAQAEQEGIHIVFQEAGFEWRESGCSMCLSMNPDFVPPGKRCASTSNRNFEGRQGRGARTHLVSPITAAASAIHGHFVNVSELMEMESVNQ